MKKLALFLILFSSLQNTYAEYRAFLLKISQPVENNPDNPSPPDAQPAFRLVRSNLDHLQYGQYYPLLPGEKIQYIDTWMCRGRTGGMTLVCKSPREIASEQAADVAAAPPTSPVASPESK